MTEDVIIARKSCLGHNCGLIHVSTFDDKLEHIMLLISYSGIFSCMRPASERRRNVIFHWVGAFNVTPSLIGWAQAHDALYLFKYGFDIDDAYCLE